MKVRTSECGKTRFDNRDTARAALTAIHRNPLEALTGFSVTGKIPSRAYRCPDCGGWHLTARKDWLVKETPSV